MNAEALYEHLEAKNKQCEDFRSEVFAVEKERDELKAQLAAANARIATQSCFWDAAIEKYDTVLSVLAGETVDTDGNEAAQAVRSLMLRGVIRQWRPIESAPKNGTLIMACVTGFIPSVVKWVTNDGESRWFQDPESFVEESHFEESWSATRYEPTHWMPLPPSPQ